MLIISHLLKQHQIVAQKYIQKVGIYSSKQAQAPSSEKDDDGYSQMMLDKLQADNNLFKMSLQKSELVIKNLKTENDYMQKQMNSLRNELERQTKELLEQQQERFLMDSQRDQQKFQNQVQSYHELKAMLSKQEIKCSQLEKENVKYQDDITKLQDNFQRNQTELESFKSQTKILTGHNQQKLLKKIENISSKSSIQLNLYSNQTSSQQIAMAQLNDHILNEWKKNQRDINISEQFMKDFSSLKLKTEDIKKEASSLKIENTELNQKNEMIKQQFGQLLDKFQTFISSNEQQIQINEQNYQQEIQKYSQEINLIKIDLSQRDNHFTATQTRLKETQEQVILLQNENIQLRTQVQQLQNASPIQSYNEENKQISFNQQIVSHLDTSIIQEEFLRNLQCLVDQSDHIFKRLSQDYVPLQQYHETSINCSISLPVVNQEQIISQQQQYFYDINSLLQNVLKCYLNKEIENSILSRNMQYFNELLNQKQGGEVVIDINGLIQQNMNEILQLRIENNQMQGVIQDLQRQIETYQPSLSQANTELQTQLLKTQILNQANNQFQYVQTLNDINAHKSFDSYQTTSYNLKNQMNQISHDTQQNYNGQMAQRNCSNCKEMQTLFDELENQITESKTKLEESTNVISSLESQVEESQGCIYARDKVKRLISKYQTVRKNNEEFQAIVIKELESLNLELSMKRLKKKGINDLDQHKDSVNQQLNNMDKFKQLFSLLKGIIIERQSDQETKLHQNEKSNKSTLYPRKMSEVTQASSQHISSQTQTQLQQFIQQANNTNYIERRQSILSQCENLSNMQTQRISNGISQPKLYDYDETPVQLITDREKQYKNHHEAQSSLATENSERNIMKPIQIEKRSSDHPQIRQNTFGKEYSMNTNSSRQIFTGLTSNKENDKQNAIPQIINNQQANQLNNSLKNNRNPGHLLNQLVPKIIQLQ
eukprot:403367628